MISSGEDLAKSVGFPTPSGGPLGIPPNSHFTVISLTIHPDFHQDFRDAVSGHLTGMPGVVAHEAFQRRGSDLCTLVIQHENRLFARKIQHDLAEWLKAQRFDIS